MSKGKEPFNYGSISGVNYGAKLAPPAKKLKAFGELLGDDWDDGVNDNVRKITVAYDELGVKSIKFEYTYETNIVVGDDHGYMAKDDKKKEFELNFKKEYIISVEGNYGKKLPPSGPVRDTIEALRNEYMTMLKFETNIATYTVPPEIDHKRGYQYVVTPFKLIWEGHKIVGFYGKSTTRIQRIGVYVKPIGDA
ncbi:unnamed protein product [Arabis nemorensis]|uniref:Jacalin-type lectin domain-containing protein n=1 Tax=Arabis nemorensis TaxID=586526 RepID=A0A565CEA8_9BRAS|nr:unnamed protein product [Arabis nemorensis]